MADRFVRLDGSPLAPGASTVRIHIRDLGSGDALIFLHGGWGYAIYPFDRQITALEHRHRVVIPDRTGYGGSGVIDAQLPDFHQRAAEETFAVLDALAIARAVLWGHSDGAVIALRMAVMAPARVEAVIAEATHFYTKKPRSRPFFETMRDAPENLGPRVATILKQEHGERWRALIATNGTAWLQIAETARSGTPDLYEGRLRELSVPTLVLHGANDPRTEPGELQALCTAVAGGGSCGLRVSDAIPQVVRTSPRLEVALFEEGGHSPHSERATGDSVTSVALAFLGGHRPPPGGSRVRRDVKRAVTTDL